MLDGGDDAAVPDGDAIEAVRLLSLAAVAREFPGERALGRVDFGLPSTVPDRANSVTLRPESSAVVGPGFRCAAPG